MTDLSLNLLRTANKMRLPFFRNRKGEISHTDGINSWTLSQWSNALAGEVGELCNVIKHYEVGDYNDAEVLPLISGEAADILTYLDLVTEKANLSLARATIAKFNSVSQRCGCSQVVLPRFEGQLVDRRWREYAAYLETQLDGTNRVYLNFEGFCGTKTPSP